MHTRSEVLNTKQTAEYLAKHNWPLTVATLNTYRSRGGGPKVTKRRHRVFYRRSDLDDYIENNEIKKFSPE